MPRNQLLTRIRRGDALLKGLLPFRPVYGLKQIHQGDYLRSKSKWAGAHECVDRNYPSSDIGPVLMRLDVLLRGCEAAAGYN